MSILKVNGDGNSILITKFDGSTQLVPKSGIIPPGSTLFNTPDNILSANISAIANISTFALSYTPVPETRTLTINGVTYDLSADRSWTIAGGVTSFNTRTGAITLLNTDVTGALGYTPVTNARTLTINGTTYDLTADRSWTLATGLTNWTEAFSSATQATSSLATTNAAANVNAAIVPKGNGAIVAAIPDGAATGGNARGIYVVDLQMQRTASNQVASSSYSVIGGGYRNRITGQFTTYSTISGGDNNFVSASNGNHVIGGGSGNQILNDNNEGNCVIGGGLDNQLRSGFSVIGGGRFNDTNTASQYYQTIGGGFTNNTSLEGATISGGKNNTASGNSSTIGGGQSITASGTHSFVGGGLTNTASNTYATVCGGNDNIAGFTGDTICGGINHRLTGSNNSGYRFIGGGQRNTIQAEQTHSTVICGGVGNTIYFGSAGGFIGGGGNAAFPGGNFLTGTNSAIVGGQANRVGSSSPINYATYCFIGGGFSNLIDQNADYSTIAGGANNTINNGIDYATIPGGYQGVASLYAQQVHASGRFSANGDAQAHELIWRRAITGTAQTELFLDGASIAAILPGTNSVWNGIIDIAAICTVTGDGTTVLGAVSGTAYKVTIKRIGTTTSLVNGIHEIGNTNHDASMTTSVFTIDANDTNESLRIRYTPPNSAGSTTVIRVVATFRGTQIQY